MGGEGAEVQDVMIARGASEMEKEPNVQTEGGPGNVVILEGGAMTRERSEWGRGLESVGAVALVTVLVSLLRKSQLRRARAAECVARKRRRWTALRQAVAMIKRAMRALSSLTRQSSAVKALAPCRAMVPASC